MSRGEEKVPDHLLPGIGRGSASFLPWRFCSDDVVLKLTSEHRERHGRAQKQFSLLASARVKALRSGGVFLNLRYQRFMEASDSLPHPQMGCRPFS